MKLTDLIRVIANGQYYAVVKNISRFGEDLVEVNFDDDNLPTSEVVAITAIEDKLVIEVRFKKK